MGKHCSREDIASCVARVDFPTRGVGFFIAPTLMLTCAHVINRTNSSDSTCTENENIKIWFKKNHKTAILYSKNQELDVALLGVPGVGSHPSAYLSASIDDKDVLTGWGWPDGGYETERIPTDFYFKGLSSPDRGSAKLTLKPDTTIRPGWSGSPLWNFNTGKVCGVIDESHNTNQPDGASGISIKDIFEFLKNSVSDNSKIAKTILTSHLLEDLGEFYTCVQSEAPQESGSQNSSNEYLSPYDALRDFLKSIKRSLQFKIDDSKAEEIFKKVKRISSSINTSDFCESLARHKTKIQMLRAFYKSHADYDNRLTPEHFVLMLLRLETQNEDFLDALPFNLRGDFENFTYRFVSDRLRTIYEIQEKDA